MWAALRRVGETVFVPEAPARLSRRGVIIGVAAVVVFAFVVGLRASSTPITTTMWAEDGRIFLADALGHGSLRSLLLGYNGYSHLVPRLVAAVAAAVDVDRAAFVIAVLACVIAALLAVFCGRAAQSHIHTPLGRYAYATLVVALPIAGVEVVGNIANLHWYLLTAAFWAVVWRPADRRNVVLACVVVALAALSDPLTAVLAPLVLWRLITVTSWRDRAVAIAFAAAMAAEALVVLNTEGMPIDPAFRAAIRLLEQRVGVGSLLGVEGTAKFVERWGVSGVHLVALLLVSVGAWLWWRYGASDKTFLAVTVVVACALFVLSVGLRGAGADPRFINGAVAGGSRYTVAPVLIALGAVVALLERIDRRAIAAIGALGLVLCGIDFRVPTLRNGDITWARGVAMARTDCRFGVDPTRISILPLTEDDAWHVPVPCSYVNP